MKQLIKKCFFLFIAIFFIGLDNLFSQNYPDSVLLTGSIYNNRSTVKKAKINIYDNNKKIKTIEVKSSNRFKAYIPINSYITIEITAPEFHNKRFAFDSHVPADLKKIPSYEFDMDIFSEEELKGVNTSLLEFPIGLVDYNERKKEFLRNKEYTKKMKKRYLDLLEEAVMVERAAQSNDE